MLRELKRGRLGRAGLLAAAGMLLAAPAMAASHIAPNCKGCHQADNETIWGTIVPGSQTDNSLAVSTGADVWQVRYDRESTLEGFTSARDLRDEKAVMVAFTPAADGWVHAEAISYKPSYHFHTMDHVVTISEVAQILKKSPQEGHYMIVDARGYDNFIEGHLPGAVNIPYYRLSEFKDRLPADKSTKIIAYCRGFT